MFVWARYPAEWRERRSDQLRQGSAKLLLANARKDLPAAVAGIAGEPLEVFARQSDAQAFHRSIEQRCVVWRRSVRGSGIELITPK